MLKKLVISKLMKIKVAHSIPGRIRFKVSTLKDIPEEYMIYEKYLHQALEKLDGIESVEVHRVTGSILVTYNVKKTYEEKILKWVEVIKEIGIKNLDLIEKYGETNTDYVVDIVEQQLDEAIKNFC
ncbi:HMA2 domain-containing protein [Peptacetobacter sp.]|uniref:HMA2 domain-containing protein n=1 Tax=Peptacetobacter sp. TaxID=2991975 RepID=UPI0026348F9D|nr:hypothetical protein [Peptacetobacter sp.]